MNTKNNFSERRYNGTEKEELLNGIERNKL
jgi:hypothetical protein